MLIKVLYDNTQVREFDGIPLDNENHRVQVENRIYFLAGSTLIDGNLYRLESRLPEVEK